jgi:hypothetical protein
MALLSKVLRAVETGEGGDLNPVRPTNTVDDATRCT